MAKHFIRTALIVSAAVTLAIVSVVRGEGQKAPASESKATYTQARPYTKDYFGPWNAASAKVHLPQITYQKTDEGLKIRVQIDDHPMNASAPHYIMWITITDGEGNILGTKEFLPTDPGPAVATFNLTVAPAKIRAFERCNIHGIWKSEIDVR